MLKTTSLILFALSAMTASGATYFLPGVSFEGGWYDADKSVNPQNGEWDGDGLMCWAAQSACMAAYWQDWYVKAGNLLSGNVPKSEIEIYNAFKSGWTNKGGLCEFGLPWYFTGDLPYNYSINVQNNPGGFSRVSGVGGYFKDQMTSHADFIERTQFKRHFYDGDGLQLWEFTEDLKRLICEEHCIIGLSLDFWGANGNNAGLRGGHAVTLWGFSTDDTTGLINAVHITDSDDKEHALKTYSVEAEGVLAWDVEFPDYLGEEVRDDYWTLTDQFFSLSVKEFTSLAAIPEPSAFGLLAGIVALVLAGTQRSRRKGNR